MAYQLRRRDLSPPGGFVATAPTGYKFQFETLSEAIERLSKHLESNNYNPDDAEGIIERDTIANILKTNESSKWLKKTK